MRIKIDRKAGYFRYPDEIKFGRKVSFVKRKVERPLGILTRIIRVVWLEERELLHFTPFNNVNPKIVIGDSFDEKEVRKRVRVALANKNFWRGYNSKQEKKNDEQFR